MSDRMIGCLAMLVIIVVCFALLVASWFFYIYNFNFRRCVALENGLNLGYNAVFDLRAEYFLPVGTAKLPNGMPLADSDISPVYYSGTTLYGRALGETSATDFWLAWRADTGLVLRDKNPRLYEELVADAGHTNVKFGPGHFSAWLVYLELAEHGEHWCRTRLVTW
ncbi:MAG: hypothetical protein NXH91_15440 [Phyllobacteriaceae bacterium]|nr:hypothetical protein [Phyllobacteriaceae bacterium]